MKALIRKEGETVRETDGVAGIEWNSGAPLTNQEWSGGPYTLVPDYIEPAPMDGDGHEEPASEDVDPVDQPKVGDDYVIIDGVRYKKC